MKNRAGKLRELLESKDFAEIRTLGHQMKGSGGGYGFDGITDIGLKIQNAADDKNAAGIVQYIDDLESYLNGLEVIY